MHSVPNLPSPIIGREVELHTLQELVLRDDIRIVTVSGSGGSGKTRLAVELAARMSDDLGARVAFADLTGVRSDACVLPTIASALGIQDAGDRTLIEAIGTVLHGEPVLLVVDNFEHVIDTAVDLAEILSVTDRLKLLVTSRQPLRLRWEHEFPLQPLAVPDAVEQTSVGAIATSPAVQLLIERIQRCTPTSNSTRTTSRSSPRSPVGWTGCRSRSNWRRPGCGCCSRPTCCADCRADSTCSVARPPTFPLVTARCATISWSHDHLSDEEQRVFRRMGVFAGGAGIRRARTRCARATTCPRTGCSSWSRAWSTSRLRGEHRGRLGGHRRGRTPPVHGSTMLETIREVRGRAAGRRRRERGDVGPSPAVAPRARRTCVETGFWTSDMRRWLSEVEREQDNLRSALDHAAGAGDPVLGLRLGASVWPFWDVRGQYREGERRLRELLGRAGRAVDRTGSSAEHLHRAG